MSIIFDVVIILILISSTYYGYKRGILDVGYKLISLILSIIISLMLFMPITYFIINNTDIDERIEEIIIKNASSKVEKGKEEEQQHHQQQQANEFGKQIQDYAKNIVNGTQDAVVSSSAKPIAINIIKIGVIIILFILIRVILSVLKMCTDLLSKLPILKQCNKLAGFVYGLLIGMLIIYGILAVLFFISSMTEEKSIIAVIEETYIAKFLCNLVRQFWDRHFGDGLKNVAAKRDGGNWLGRQSRHWGRRKLAWVWVKITYN